LSTMDEAEKVAMDFVKRKKPDGEVSVRGAEAKSPNRWAVKGTVFTKRDRGGAEENWTVEIEDHKVVSYTFEPGVGWFIA
jgi:hypothetical protein